MSAPALTLKEVNDRMAALDAKYPQLCVRRAFPNGGDDYYLEITAGLDRTKLDLDKTPASSKRGVLFVSAHEGNEFESTRPLFESVEALLAAAVTAAAATPGAAGGTPPQVTLPSGQAFALADITTILSKFDILVVPVANTRGYPNTRGDGSIDPNRDYAVFWNAKHLDTSGLRTTWENYFDGGKLPVGWNKADPGVGFWGPATSQTAQNIIWLMRKRVQTFVNLQTGYAPHVIYPWGACDNSTKPANPASHPYTFTQTATNGNLRYCDPKYGQVKGALMAGKAGYTEYMPMASQKQLYAAARAAADGGDVSITGAAVANVKTYVGQANTQTSGSSDGFVTSPTPAADPAGGTCTDYFFSLDILNRIALHVECGSSVFETLDKNLRVKFVTGLMFGLLKHLSGLTLTDTAASAETKFERAAFVAEQAADWARKLYP
jgi:hypothetical protein